MNHILITTFSHRFLGPPFNDSDRFFYIYHVSAISVGAYAKCLQNLESMAYWFLRDIFLHCSHNTTQFSINRSLPKSHHASQDLNYFIFKFITTTGFTPIISKSIRFVWPPVAVTISTFTYSPIDLLSQNFKDKLTPTKIFKFRLLFIQTVFLCNIMKQSKQQNLHKQSHTHNSYSNYISNCGSKE